MIPWSKSHKNLAALALFAAVVFTVVFIVLIRPKQKEVARLKSEADTLQKTLMAKGWPLDGSRLESLFEEKSRELERLMKQSDEILKNSTSMFDKKIEPFESREKFHNDVTRLDFQEEFIKIEQHFKEQDVVFSEGVLNLSEKTDSPYTYQLMIQLWTVQAILDIALSQQLHPIKESLAKDDDTGEGRKTHVSQVSVLPMKAYFTSGEEKEPYLLEFPVRMVLRGNMNGLTGLLQALHAGGNFYPITNLELRKAMPSHNRTAADQIEADIQCSSFYRLRDTGVKIKPVKSNPLPPGA